MDKMMKVNGVEYTILKLLGHGKGGYSYLAAHSGQHVVLKQIHHEPCDYYSFGNKIEAERYDYERLRNAGIRIPQMLAIDVDTERIVKEYIEGDTIFDMVRENWPIAPFVVQGNLIYYVDYECNDYMDEWNFENWGVKYWSRTPEFETYLKEH